MFRKCLSGVKYREDTCLRATKFKAVVGGTAGPAMAGPLFGPKMVLAGPLFRPIMIFIIFCQVIFRLIKA